MLVLHGTWVPSHGARPACFTLWAETARAQGTPVSRRGQAATSRPPRHPFATRAEEVRGSLATQYPAGWVEAMPSGAVFARLPSANGAPLSSPDLAIDGFPHTESPGLATWKVEALTAEAADTSTLLLPLTDEACAPSLVLGDDLRYWIVASRFALELLARQRFLPSLQKEGDLYCARWGPMLDDPSDAQRFETLVRSMPPVCRALAWDAAAPSPQPRELLHAFLAAVVDAVAREAPPPKSARQATRRASMGAAWLNALFGDSVLHADSRELVSFYQQYCAWTEPIAARTTSADTFRVCLRLDPPPACEGGERVVIPRQGANDWTLHYLLQASDDPSLLVPAEAVWRQRGSTARFLNRKFDEPQERLLAGLGHAARIFPPIESSLRTTRPETCGLTAAQAYDFIREGAPLLKGSGFGVLVPGLETKLGVRVRLGGGKGNGKSGGPAAFGWDTLVEYDWQLALGDQTLSREEFEALARIKEPLVQVRGRWIELQPDQIERVLAFFQRRASGQMSLQEAVKLALAPDGDPGLPVKEVAAEGWVDEVLGRLRGGDRREEVAEPAGFAGRLRPYQKVGVAWLAALRRFGVGACLADDMGLGKTVQLIALLLHQPRNGQEKGPAPTLLVCPTSVVGNWRRELERFAPSLRVLVHHGAGRQKESFADEAVRHDVVISTYALLHRDEAELAGVDWGDVVLDEAQNVKNPSTKAAQVVRALPARWRAALTGTPVENRLTDLWSIFQFLNPGYLGSGEEFRKRFAIPIERARDATTTARLKKLAGPFILRRVKSDQSIIQDLPEKNEMKVYCTLTREQATLYEAVVKESLRQIEEAEGVQRRGQILATLTKLKQVCNHPALFLHDGSRLDGRSGKLARLGEMLEEVMVVGDRALLFTQYSEMGKLLKAHLETVFGREVLFLHGGTPAAERDRMVARFQAEGRGPQIFVLSVKAGGTGLNLTRANHVFHVDRWWNPAVENQATDRAFRIGQTRAVQVHKFLCAGTFEEALDQLIERKVELSQAIVGTGEAWITEMSTDELRALFALRRDAITED